MRPHRTAGEAVGSGKVYGLGIADALRLELAPVQVPWLVDELDEMRRPLEETLQRAVATDDTAVVQEVEYEIRLLRLMRAELPGREPEGPVVFTGPAAVVHDIVRGTMRNVTDSLAEQAKASSVEREDAAARLRDTAAAAHAWVETFLACKAVADFNFDPDVDPLIP